MKNLYYATQASVKRSICLALTLWSTAISICVYAEPATYEALAAPVNPPAGYREPWRGTGQNNYDDWMPLRYQQQGNAPGYWESAWGQTFGATSADRKALAEAATGDIWRACRVGYHNYDNMPLAHLNWKNFWKEYASSIFDSLNYCVYPGEEWNLVQRLQSTIEDLKYGGKKVDGTAFPGMNGNFYKRAMVARIKEDEDTDFSFSSYVIPIMLLSLSDKRAIYRVYLDPATAIDTVTSLVTTNSCVPEDMTQCTQIQAALLRDPVTDALPIVENALYRFHTFLQQDDLMWDNPIIAMIEGKPSTKYIVFATDMGRVWLEVEFDNLRPLLTEYCNTSLSDGTEQARRICAFYNKFKEEWKVLNGSAY